MKVSCLQEHLAKGLSTVGRAVSTRSTLPVLANVLLSTDNGRLKLSATNLEIAITCWIEARVEEEGSVTVPARTFSDLVNTLPQEQVELLLHNETQTLHVASGRIEANVRGIAAEQFPKDPQVEMGQEIRLDVGQFKQMISQVAFAAATDDQRPILTGVSMVFEGDELRMAATDAFRLSVVNATMPARVHERISLIVPARALGEVARVAGDDDESIYIVLPEGHMQLVFKMDSVVVRSQLIDGTFPDFSNIIPRGAKTRAVMGTASFQKACKAADIFAREASHTARIHINPGNELMNGFASISATSAETGDNVAQVDATVDGKEIEIAFNVRFINDVLTIIDTPQVALETNSPMEPGVIRPVGESRFFHVIMPMHFGR